jgi:hypothetical protein
MSLGSSANTIIMVASILISVTAIVFAHNEFKRNNEGFMSYSEGLGIGVLVNVIAGAMSGAFGVLYRTVIDKGFDQRMMENTRRTLEESGMYTEAQIEQTLEITQRFSTPTMSLLIGLVMAALGGLVMSLIISAITKNKRPMF